MVGMSSPWARTPWISMFWCLSDQQYPFLVLKQRWLRELSSLQISGPERAPLICSAYLLQSIYPPLLILNQLQNHSLNYQTPVRFIMGELEFIRQPHFFIKAFISFIYFIQGFYLSLGGTIVLLYPSYPSHEVLSHFSIAFLPFSFKYVTAPIVEKFTMVRYGRRKFWIVLSLLASTLLSFPLTWHLTDQQNHMHVVIFIFLILVFVSMGDIALDAASVKELQNPVLSSMLQLFFQSFGMIAGGLLMLKVVQPSDWKLFKTDALCSPQAFVIFVGIINGVVAILIHFFYQERVLKEEEDMKTPTTSRIYQFYLHFINPKYKLCRFGLYLVLFWQALKFFTVGFEPQAIHHGFPKQTIPEIHTFCIFLSVPLNLILTKYVKQDNLLLLAKWMYLIQVALFSVLFCVNSFNYYVVVGTTILIQVAHLMSFLVISSKVNSFGESSLAGLSITTLASLMNFGNNTWLQLKVISLFGYYPSVIGGFVISIVICFFSTPIMSWIQSGKDEQQVPDQTEPLKAQ